MRVVVLVGTYNKFVFGLTVDYDRDQHKITARNTHLKWTSSFSCEAHSGPVKCVSASARLAATGGSDQTIRVYDLVNQVEYGSLYQHEGAITTLDFLGSSHLLSGGEDGKLCVWRTQDWKCLKVLPGHSHGLHCVGIHPSGKAALSCSKDSTLKLWDLVKGSLQVSRKLKKAGTLVCWSPQGHHYAMVSDSIQHSYIPQNLLTVYTKDAETAATITLNSKILCIIFLTDHVIVTGGANGQIHVWDLAHRVHLAELAHHQSRIKGLGCAAYSDGKSADNTASLVASASSDGTVCLWDMHPHLRAVPVRGEADHTESWYWPEERWLGADNSAVPLHTLQPVCVSKSQVRVTCLAVSSQQAEGVAEGPSQASQTGTGERPAKKRRRNPKTKQSQVAVRAVPQLPDKAQEMIRKKTTRGTRTRKRK